MGEACLEGINRDNVMKAQTATLSPNDCSNQREGTKSQHT